MACQRSVNIGDVSGQDGGRVSFSEIAGGGAAAKEGAVGAGRGKGARALWAREERSALLSGIFALWFLK